MFNSSVAAGDLSQSAWIIDAKQNGSTCAVDRTSRRCADLTQCFEHSVATTGAFRSDGARNHPIFAAFSCAWSQASEAHPILLVPRHLVSFVP
jgi:hypothetical protein